MDRWVGPPIGLGVKVAGARNKCERWGARSANPVYFYLGRMGQLSLWSHVLLLALGVPPMMVLACHAQRLSQDSRVWRVLTTPDVGNVGVPDHQV